MPEDQEADPDQEKLILPSDGKEDTSRSELETDTLSMFKATEESHSDAETELLINNSSSIQEPRPSLQEDTETFHLLPNQVEETDTDLSQEEPKEHLQSFSPDQEAEVSSKWLPTKTLYGEPAEAVLKSSEETEDKTEMPAISLPSLEAEET